MSIILKVKKMKIKALDWKKISVIYIDYEWVITKIYEKLLQINRERADNFLTNSP